MTRDRPVRRLVAQQLGLRHGIDLLAVANALERELGIELPVRQRDRLGSYGALLQLLRDALAARRETLAEEEWAACFVRARVVAGGADGRVLLVRVGWLTPDLAAAVADDVRHAPPGTRLDVLVPDDLSDAELQYLRLWLRWLVSQHVHVEVRRSRQGPPDLSRPAPPAWDDLSQANRTPDASDPEPE